MQLHGCLDGGRGTGGGAADGHGPTGRATNQQRRSCAVLFSDRMCVWGGSELGMGWGHGSGHRYVVAGSGLGAATGAHGDCQRQ